jgi:D-alanyl-D-alanine carboxypeptidase
MTDSAIKQNKERVLPDERYNAKLFRQAYKAAKEAKEIDIKRKKKNALLKIVYFSLIPIVLGFSVSLFLRFRTVPIEYVESMSTPVQSNLYSWDELGVDKPAITKGIDIQTTSLSHIVVDIKTGEILSAKEIEEKRAIASVTKLMTVLVLLDTFDLEQNIVVSTENIPEDLDWKLELEEGDNILVKELLEAMLISSYNDTAYIIANAYPDSGYDGFIIAMNNKAKVLGMTKSSFSNPAGLDEELNYSTALDISKLVSAVLNNEIILNIVKNAGATITWRSKDGVSMAENIYTTNQLINVNPYNKGLKTGSTKEAGKCFVGYFEYPSGKRIFTVVLGSEDRFGDTNKLEMNFRK